MITKKTLLIEIKKQRNKKREKEKKFEKKTKSVFFKHSSDFIYLYK